MKTIGLIQKTTVAIAVIGLAFAGASNKASAAPQTDKDANSAIYAGQTDPQPATVGIKPSALVSIGTTLNAPTAVDIPQFTSFAAGNNVVNDAVAYGSNSEVNADTPNAAGLNATPTANATASFGGSTGQHADATFTNTTTPGFIEATEGGVSPGLIEVDSGGV